MTHEHLGLGRCAGHAGSSGAGPFALEAATHRHERDRAFSPTHLVARLTLDPATKSVAGTVTYTVSRVARAATHLELDAVDFDVTEVRVDGRVVRAEYDGKRLRVPVPASARQADVSVDYTARPRRGLYFIEPDDARPHLPRQMWTQFQEEDARHVLPCHDAPHVKVTSEVTLRVPTGLQVLSNGELATEPVEDGAFTAHTFRLDVPHPSYLVTFVAGTFAVEEGEVDGVRLRTMVPPERAGDAARTFGRTRDMLRLFARRFGVAYPYRSYTQVVVADFTFGGMENTTATTLHEGVLLDAKASVDVVTEDLVAHELAHQWFGDLVTCRDWSEGWLNEGFATYCESLWREHTEGEDGYFQGLERDLGNYLGEAEGRYARPVVCRDYEAPIELFDRHLYEKGGLVLHALREELGDEPFFDGVRRYVERSRFGVVETNDLLRALEETSGRSLGAFFEQHLERAGHPKLTLSVAWDDGVLTVDARQDLGPKEGEKPPAPFVVPLDLVVVSEDGVQLEALRLDRAEARLAVRVSARPLHVVVDPRLRIVGRVDVEAPLDMLRHQLAHGGTSRARRQAAAALAKARDPRTLAALVEVASDEGTYWGVRAAAARALGKIGGPEAARSLGELTTTPHARVRRAVVEALGATRRREAEPALRARAQSDASWLVEAEALRALGDLKDAAPFDLLVDRLDRASWGDVVAAAAVDALGRTRDPRGVPHVLRATRYGHPARVRKAALHALVALSSERATRERLEELLEDADASLRLEVARALTELGDARAEPAVRAAIAREHDPRARRAMRETVRALAAGDTGAARALGDRVERLAAENQELASRLAVLEAKVTGRSARAGRTPAPSRPSPRAGKPPRTRRR